MKLTKLQQGVHQFARPSMIRPELHCVMFDGVTAVATDSFRLVEIKNIAPDAPQAEAPVLLASKSLKAAKFKTEAALERENGKLYATSPEGTIKLEEMGEVDSYPKYKEIMPRTHAHELEYVEINVNGVYLADIAKHLAKLGKFETITVKIPKDSTVKPMVITATGKGHDAYAMLMPMRR